MSIENRLRSSATESRLNKKKQTEAMRLRALQIKEEPKIAQNNVLRFPQRVSIENEVQPTNLENPLLRVRLGQFSHFDVFNEKRMEVIKMLDFLSDFSDPELKPFKEQIVNYLKQSLDKYNQQTQDKLPEKPTFKSDLTEQETDTPYPFYLQSIFYLFEDSRNEARKKSEQGENYYNRYGVVIDSPTELLQKILTILEFDQGKESSLNLVFKPSTEIANSLQRVHLFPSRPLDKNMIPNNSTLYDMHNYKHRQEIQNNQFETVLNNLLNNRMISDYQKKLCWLYWCFAKRNNKGTAIREYKRFVEGTLEISDLRSFLSTVSK